MQTVLNWKRSQLFARFNYWHRFLLLWAFRVQNWICAQSLIVLVVDSWYIWWLTPIHRVSFISIKIAVLCQFFTAYLQLFCLCFDVWNVHKAFSLFRGFIRLMMLRIDRFLEILVIYTDLFWVEGIWYLHFFEVILIILGKVLFYVWFCILLVFFCRKLIV